MPSQMELAAARCHTDILRRAFKAPKTMEGQAEAFARLSAFYDLHRNCPIVTDDALKHLYATNTLEAWAKTQELDAKDFKKAVKEAKKVLTKEKTKAASKGMLLNLSLARALAVWGITTVQQVHFELGRCAESDAIELNYISSDQHDEARERIEMQEEERQVHWHRKWTAAEIPELKAKYEAELKETQRLREEAKDTPHRYEEVKQSYLAMMKEEKAARKK